MLPTAAWNLDPRFYAAGQAADVCDMHASKKNLMEELLSDPVQLRKLLTDYPEKAIHLEKENTELRPNGMPGSLKLGRVNQLLPRVDWFRP